MTRLDHPRHEGLDAVHDAVHVHAVHPGPVVRGRFPDVRGGCGDPGIVEEQVAGAVRVVDLVGERTQRAQGLDSVRGQPVQRQPAQPDREVLRLE